MSLPKASFPQPPTNLMLKPSDSELVLLPENRVLQLSDIVDTVKKNYATSYGYRIRLEELQQWVRDQTKVFEEFK